MHEENLQQFKLAFLQSVKAGCLWMLKNMEAIQWTLGFPKRWETERNKTKESSESSTCLCWYRLASVYSTPTSGKRAAIAPKTHRTSEVRILSCHTLRRSTNCINPCHHPIKRRSTVVGLSLWWSWTMKLLKLLKLLYPQPLPLSILAPWICWLLLNISSVLQSILVALLHSRSDQTPAPRFSGAFPRRAGCCVLLSTIVPVKATAARVKMFVTNPRASEELPFQTLMRSNA